MDTVSMPYKLQVFVPDHMRDSLKLLAYKKNTSLQKIVVALLGGSTQQIEAGTNQELEEYVTAAIERQK